LTKKVKNRKVFSRKLTLVFVILILVLIIAGFLFKSYYADKVKAIALNEINSQLTVEVEVGDIEFSIIKDFPNASLRFSEVSSKQKDENQSKDPLIKANRVSILFNVWDIVMGNYKISKIQLSDAFLTIVDYGNGKNNFQIGNGKDKQGDNGANININKIILKNVHILYINYPSDQEYLLQTAHSEISGQFSQEEFSLQIDGDIFSEHIKSGKTVLFSDKNIGLSLTLDVNSKKSIYEIKKCEFVFSGLPITVKGQVKGKHKSRTIDLSVVCRETRLKSLFKEIPPQYLKPLKGLNLSGQISFAASIKGRFSGNHLPLIDLKFSVSDGQMKFSKPGIVLKKIALTGNFSNGKLHTSETYSLSISGFNSKLKTGDFYGKLTVDNFNTPNVSVEAKTNVELEELYSYFKFSEVEAVSGRIDIDIAFQSRLNNFDKFTVADFISSRTQGKMQLQDVNFKLKDSQLDFNSFEGRFSFSNKDLIVEKLSGNLSTSDFTLSGKFKNLSPWLLTANERIVINAGFTSSNINLDDLLLDSNNETDSVYKLAFSDRIKFDLGFEVDNFSFGKFKAESLLGNIRYNEGIVKLSETSFKSMDGNSCISGIIDGTKQDIFSLKCDADIRKVNIQELFYQFGNFGQSNLTSSNLNGEASASFYFEANMNPQLRISPESVYTTSDIIIEKGELLNYYPLYSLASFIKVDELQNVQFSKLQNHIEIKDRIVFIPEMEINSNTLSLKLSGSHTFDNKIDYHFSLFLSDLLHRKKKQQDDKDYIIQVEENGGPRVHLSMTGTATDPQIKYDVKAARKSVRSSLERERQNLKEVFNEEFSRNEQQGETKSYFEKGDSTQHDFILEWNTEAVDSTEKRKHKEKKYLEKKLPKKKSKDFIISFDDDTIN